MVAELLAKFKQTAVAGQIFGIAGQGKKEEVFFEARSASTQRVAL
jgi:hypothetical protein